MGLGSMTCCLPTMRWPLGATSTCAWAAIAAVRSAEMSKVLLMIKFVRLLVIFSEPQCKCGMNSTMRVKTCRKVNILKDEKQIKMNE